MSYRINLYGATATGPPTSKSYPDLKISKNKYLGSEPHHATYVRNDSTSQVSSIPQSTKKQKDLSVAWEKAANNSANWRSCRKTNPLGIMQLEPTDLDTGLSWKGCYC